MFILKICFFFFLMFVHIHASAQSLYYSRPDLEKDIYTTTSYFVVGKMEENIIIAKRSSRGFYINLYNANMTIKQSVKFADFDHTIEVIDIVNCNDNALLFFKKQFDNNYIVFCIGLNARGVPISEVITIDTINISHDISIACSENLEYVGIFLKSLTDTITYCRQIIISNDLKIRRKVNFELEKNSFNTKSLLVIDNNGNLYFINKSYNPTKEKTTFQLAMTTPTSSSILTKIIDLRKSNPMDVRLHVNNLRQCILIYAFLKDANNVKKISGLYTAYFNPKSQQYEEENLIKINSKTIPQYANINWMNAKLGNIVFCKDSSMFIFMEENAISIKTESNNTSLNLGVGNWTGTEMGVSIPVAVTKTNVFYSGDINLFKIKKANVLYSNQIIKKQELKGSNSLLSYSLLNNNNTIQIYFNNIGINGSLVLNNYEIRPYGEISKKSLNKIQNKNYELMIKYAKQIDKKTLIVPCVNGGILCFAKITI